MILTLANGKKFFLGKFRAKVLNNDDPDKRARIQVNVPGIVKESGWVSCCTQIPGFFGMPQNGDFVFVEFLNGEVDHPIWSGTWYALRTDVADGEHLSLTGSSEADFQTWYAAQVKFLSDHGQVLNPNPDDPKHKYDYRAAFTNNSTPGIDPSDGLYHWSSEFKDGDHPNRYVNGVDTITGKPMTEAPFEGNKDYYVLQHPKKSYLKLDQDAEIKAQNVRINCDSNFTVSGSKATIDCSTIIMNGGSRPVARLGDKIIGTVSGHSVCNGQIVEGTDSVLVP